MNSKNLLSTLLYALIGLLVVVVGYKACQIRKEADAKKLEDSRFSQQLRDMGYVDTDSAAAGSAYVSETGAAANGATYPDGAKESTTSTAPAPVTNSASGIEGAAATSTAKGADSSPGKQEVDEEGQKVRVTDIDAEFGMVDKPKYMVITGSFRKLANARKSMEALVKKGYTNAEVGRFNRGTFACAIAKRSDSLKDAQAFAKKLKGQGFPDAFVKTKK
jgi:SPOR domain